jgi:hypothetical protein
MSGACGSCAWCWDLREAVVRATAVWGSWWGRRQPRFRVPLTGGGLAARKSALTRPVSGCDPGPAPIGRTPHRVAQPSSGRWYLGRAVLGRALGVLCLTVLLLHRSWPPPAFAVPAGYRGDRWRSPKRAGVRIRADAQLRRGSAPRHRREPAAPAVAVQHSTGGCASGGIGTCQSRMVPCSSGAGPMSREPPRAAIRRRPSASMVSLASAGRGSPLSWIWRLR